MFWYCKLGTKINSLILFVTLRIYNHLDLKEKNIFFHFWGFGIMKFYIRKREYFVADHEHHIT